MRGLALVLIVLGAEACAASFPHPMTASDLARLASGDALVAYLHAPGASSAVCDLQASGPHLMRFDAGVAAVFDRRLVSPEDAPDRLPVERREPRNGGVRTAEHRDPDQRRGARDPHAK